jgi:hypothetical protein
VRSVILYCPHLGRDISGLLTAVPDAEILEGVKTLSGAVGCLEMHKEAVRLAQIDNDPYLFVMEDDCRFTSRFSLPQWQSDASWAEFHQYDVMVGGSTRTYDEKLVRLGMIEVSAFHSAHCVIYFKSGYDKILQAVQPFDYSLGHDTKCKCVLVYPFIAVQLASFSGILQQQVDYVPLYEQHERALAQVLGL